MARVSRSTPGPMWKMWLMFGLMMPVLAVTSADDSVVVGGCSQVADVIFLIDSSVSVRQTCSTAADGTNTPEYDNWQLILKYVSQVVRAMPIGTNRTRVGVVTFSGAVDDSHVIPLGAYSNATALGDEILKLPFIGRNTNMTGALRYVRQMFSEASTENQQSSSSSTEQIAVLLTDGINNVDSDPIQEARLVKQDGIKLYVIGVSDYIDIAELKEMASPPAEYSFLSVQDFQHLDSLIDQTLNRLVCSETPALLPCRDSRMDVALILDSSGSILVTVNGSRDLTNWNLMKNFVITLIENLRVSSDVTRVALVRFSYVADIIFPLNKYFSASGAVEAVREMDYIGSSTNTSGALNVMRTTVFTTQNGARPGIRKVGIVITDGQSDSQSSTTVEAEAAKAAGIQMFAIGLTDLIDINELRRIASSPLDTHCYNRTTYALVQTVTTQLLWSVCHSMCASDTGSSASADASATGTTTASTSNNQQPCSNVTSFCGPKDTQTWLAYPGHLLLGLSYATLDYVTSVSQCQARCLQDYECRSIEYIAHLQSCSISYYTKDDAPAGSFRTDSEVDYYELSCISNE